MPEYLLDVRETVISTYLIEAADPEEARKKFEANPGDEGEQISFSVYSSEVVDYQEITTNG